MTDLQAYSFTRYLSSKKSVDDRALNQRVWKALHRELAVLQPGNPVRILEIGAGIGTMVERFLEQGGLPQLEYTVLDAQAENIAWGRSRLPRWAEAHGFQVIQEREKTLQLQSSTQQIKIAIETADIFDFIAAWQGKRCWDLLVANAFLDLVDIPASLPKLFSLSAPGGLFYFTINFDGATLLEPALEPELDEQIERLYHRTMDERKINGAISGDSRAGRHLFENLRRAGALVLEAGASDWVVFAQDGKYPDDEAYFLDFILHTIEQALAGRPELDAGRFSGWMAARRAQAVRGELVYIAHQLDFFGCIRR